MLVCQALERMPLSIQGRSLKVLIPVSGDDDEVGVVGVVVVVRCSDVG